MVNGVLISRPRSCVGIDARTGGRSGITTTIRRRRSYREPRSGNVQDWLYFETPDCHLVCLNAKDGKQRWKVELGDVSWDTSHHGAVGMGNHVIVGVFGRRDRCSGYLTRRSGKPSIAVEMVFGPEAGRSGIGDMARTATRLHTAGA